MKIRTALVLMILGILFSMPVFAFAPFLNSDKKQQIAEQATPTLPFSLAQISDSSKELQLPEQVEESKQFVDPAERSGMVIVADRSSAVYGLGHTGVAFQNSDGTYTCGAVEGHNNKAIIFKGDKNGGWYEKFKTLDEVEKKFSELGYDKIKILFITNPDPAKAERTISDFPDRGYNFLTNNCLYAVIEVLDAYGAKNSAEPFLCRPNSYFDSIQGTKYIWDENQKKYIILDKRDGNENSPGSIDRLNFTPRGDSGDGGDLGGVNFTSINLNYISVNPSPADGIDFNFTLNALKADRSGVGIDVTRSTLIAMTAFMTGLVMPDDIFWVNLNPWEPGRIIDEQLGQTEVGRIMLDADLQMKKDFSRYGNPCENETGKELYNLLNVKREALTQKTMKKFPGEIKSDRNVMFGAATRFWIVPEKAYAYINGTSIYIINATLTIYSEPVSEHSYYVLANQDSADLSNGCLEELNISAKEYGQYAKELEEKMILPYVVHDINHGEKYRNLRSIYISLALAQWYKSNMPAQINIFEDVQDSSNIELLETIRVWNPKDIYDKYVDSYKSGEYKCWQNKTTEVENGIMIESSLYTAGGVDFAGITDRLSQIKELPPEVQDRVESAINKGYAVTGKDISFGNSFYVSLRQQGSGSGKSSRSSPSNQPELRKKTQTHGHSEGDNSTEKEAVYSSYKS